MRACERRLSLVAFLSLLSGCRDTSKDHLAGNDLLALRTIYDTSSGTFHSSEIDIHVLRGGSVKIQIHGNLTSKAEVDGDVWIPVLLVPKLPAYFHVVQASGTIPITLEAYEFKGGLWCIAAIVAQPREPERPNSASGEEVVPSVPRSLEAEAAWDLQERHTRTVQAAPRPKLLAGLLDFQIGLASEEFLNGLPFSIPSDPSGESTSISIELPSGASFSNKTSAVGANVARGWQSGELVDTPWPHRTSQSVTMQNLTPIFEPASTDLKRAATLTYPDTVAWDFSKVSFNQPGLFSQFRSWFIPSVVTILFLAFAVWLRFYYLSPVLSDIERLSASLDVEPREVEGWFDRFRGKESSEGPAPDWAFMEAELRQSLAAFRNRFGVRLVGSASPRTLEKLSNRIERVQQAIREAPSKASPNQKAPAPDPVVARLAVLRKCADNLTADYQRYRAIRTILWIVCFGVLLGLLVVIGTLARAQMRHQRPSNAELSLPILCDLNVSLAPHDLTKIGEKFDVLVRFSPLTGDSHQTESKIRFGTGDAQGVTIDTVAPPTDKNVSVVQQSETHVTLKVPLRYSPLVRRINAISQWTELIKMPDGYATTMDKANHLNFTYTLQGVARPHLVSSSGRRWLYLFPFDSSDLEIPLNMEQASLLNHLDVSKPTNDYFAKVTIEGTHPDIGSNNRGSSVALTESENSDHYVLTNPDAGSRLPISANGGIVIHARFSRGPWQRWGLTWGVAILAILVGILGAWFTTLPDKDWKGWVFTILGITGLVFAVRAAVLATYKDLPTLMTGQGTTIFELVYVGSVLLMILTLVITRRILKP